MNYFHTYIGPALMTNINQLQTVDEALENCTTRLINNMHVFPEEEFKLLDQFIVELASAQHAFGKLTGTEHIAACDIRLSWLPKNEVELNAVWHYVGSLELNETIILSVCPLPHLLENNWREEPYEGDD